MAYVGNVADPRRNPALFVSAAQIKQRPDREHDERRREETESERAERGAAAPRPGHQRPEGGPGGEAESRPGG